MAKGPESKVKGAVKAFLTARGAWFYMPVLTGYGISTLDFIGCYKGRFFAIETKAPGKKPTPRQSLTIEQIGSHGGQVFVIDSVDRVETTLWPWFTHVAVHGA